MQPAAQQSVIRARPSAALPVAQLVLGRPVEEAAELLGRIFNLCHMAQTVAARAAFGLPIARNWSEDLRQEIIRAHLTNLCLKWPTLLGLSPVAMPRSTQAIAALFGATGKMPKTEMEFLAFLKSDLPLARLLGDIQRRFPVDVGTRQTLPLTRPGNIFDEDAQENSVAARRAHHPVLQYIEHTCGRGPFWSATAIAYDLDACLAGHLPLADLQPGRAVVPAARGLYGMTAEVTNGRVARFARITPTDHLLAPHGPLHQSLRSLPRRDAATLAPLLLSILDPCIPVELEQTKREPCHA